MKRSIGFLFLSFFVCVIASQAFIRAADKVERRDKKGGTISVTGTILEESAAGVKMKAAGLGKEEMIPSSDIVRVSYDDLPVKASLDLGKLAAAETTRDFPALLKGYEGVQAMPELKTSSARTRRYIDYRVVTLRVAVAEGDEQLKAAARGLADFMTAHADSWEFPHVARQLARLQADTADYASATKTYEMLEKAAGVPGEFKREATAALIDIAFQSEDYAAGKKRIEDVSEEPDDARGASRHASICINSVSTRRPATWPPRSRRSRKRSAAPMTRRSKLWATTSSATSIAPRASRATPCGRICGSMSSTTRTAANTLRR